MRGEEEGKQGSPPRLPPARRYVLPVDALVLMSEVGQLCFQAKLTALPGQARGSYQIRLILRSGTVATCQILRDDGAVILAGSPAWQMARALGDLAWSLSLPDPPAPAPMVGPEEEPKEESGSDPSLEAADWSGLVPHRGSVPPAFHRLPPRVRRVLNLVDGRRTLAQIARLLHLTLADVCQMVRQAREAGWIE